MVDATEFVIITSVVQTIVITLTLVVFIFQFRSQEKALKESAVQNVMGRFTDYIRMLVERPELAKMLNEFQSQGRDVEKVSPEEESTYAYLMVGYGLFEEVYSLYKKKWMDEETWQQWASFLERMTAHPLFRRIHTRSIGYYDKDFQELVSKLMEQKK